MSGRLAERSDAAGVTHTLATKIAAALPQMSKKHKEIAQFILAHGDFVAFASAQQLGLETDSSAATVVRFCQALGYEGYPQLQEAIRVQFAQERSAVQHLEEQVEGVISSEDLLTQVFVTEIRNLQRTVVGTSGDRLRAAAGAIYGARQVLIVGSGLAATLVEYLAYALQTIDVPTRCVTGGEEPLALALAFLQPMDVVVAISFRAKPRYTVTAIEHARAIGATSIGITNNELSPVAREADYAFSVSTEGLSDRPSPVAATALINALIAELALVEPEQATDLQRRIDLTYKESELLDE